MGNKRSMHFAGATKQRDTWIGFYDALVLIVALLAGRCTYNLAGFGSETTNGDVAGIIADENGQPAPAVQVKLIPFGYNPVLADSASNAKILVDTTDMEGRYRFIVKDTGVFNVQAIHPVTGKRTVHDSVKVHNDTIDLKTIMLTQTGTIKVILTDTVDTANGYVYVRGTDFYKTFAKAKHYLYKGKRFLVFDSLPSVKFSGFYYGKKNSVEAPVYLTDAFTVSTADTVTVTALYFWSSFTSANSGLPDDAVTAVLVDASGTRWIGTAGSGLVVYNGSAWTAYTIANSSLQSNTITALCQDKEGSIWIGTAGGVMQYNNGVWQLFNKQNSLIPDDRITALASDAKNVKWIGTSRGCVTYDGVTWTIYDTATSKIRENYITGIAVGKNDKKFITTWLGLVVYDNGKWSVYYKGSDSSAITDTVTGVCGSTINTVWIATVKGVIAFDMDISMWFTVANDLTNKRISMIGMAREGTIWAGTSQGGFIASFNGIGHDPLVLYYNNLNAQVLQGCSAVTCMAADINNTVYFGTKDKGLIQVRFAVP